MPLKKGTSKKAVSSNIKELMTGKMGKTRAKAVKTIAKKRGITTRQARAIQAKAIALNNKK